MPDTAPRIDRNQLKRRLDGGEPITFVDARSNDDWDRATERLPGALRIPRNTERQRAGSLPKGQLIVVYGATGEDGGVSAQVTHELRLLNYINAVLLEGGFRGWKDAGYPTERREDLPVDVPIPHT